MAQLLSVKADGNATAIKTWASIPLRPITP
jgi:hypothetical protein